MNQNKRKSYIGKSKQGFKRKRYVRRPIPRSLPSNLLSLGTEVKSIDIAETNSVMNTVGTPTVLYLLNGIQIGSAFYNRIGSKIEMKNLHVRGYIALNQSSVEDLLRVLIVYDRQPNGALPVITDILKSRDQTGTANTTGVSEINLDQRDRYTILRDHEIRTPSVTYAGGVESNGPQWSGDTELEINFFIKLKGLITQFKSSTNPSTIVDINTGALYLIPMSTGANAWSLLWGARLRYYDR